MSEFVSKFHPRRAEGNAVEAVSLNLFRILAGSNTGVEGIVFGGSYANGKFVLADDVDIDFLYETKPERSTFVQAVAMQAYSEHKLQMHVRTHIGRDGSAITLPKSNAFAPPALVQRIPLADLTYVYQRHRNSPFIAKNQDVIDFWHLHI